MCQAASSSNLELRAQRWKATTNGAKDIESKAAMQNRIGRRVNSKR
jgi:hypothetical protein